jgi:hypothetical protein
MPVLIIGPINKACKRFFTVRLPSPANAGQHARQGPPERAHGVKLPAAAFAVCLYVNQASGPWPVGRGALPAMRYARPVACPEKSLVTLPVPVSGKKPGHIASWSVERYR